MSRPAGEPGGPDDTYCRNCGQSRIAYNRGGRIQECWVEDYDEQGPYAVQIRHKWPLVGSEVFGRSSLVSITMTDDNLDVVEGQANGEGQGIGFDDADLGGVEPGVGGEGTAAAPVLTEGREDSDGEEQDH